MSTVPPAIEELARRLLAIETVGGKPSAAHGDEAAYVLEKLRITLSRLMGIVGFRALLSRALALAKTEAPALGEVRVREDDALEGFDAIGRNIGAETAKNGGTVLVGRFLELLVTFVGKPLTLRLVRDTWPEVSMDSVDVNGEEKNS